MMMRNSIIAVMVVLASSMLAEAADPIRLRILSYNIHHAEGVDRELDLERIASVIRSTRPDLVAVQEVDQNVARSRSIDQPEELARLTNLESIFGPNIDLQGGRYGNVVLSRFPVVRHKNHPLPNFENGEQRGVVVAEVQLPNGKESIRFFATHLDHRGNEQERLASARKINELLREQNGPAILAGDLNATPDSETLSRFQEQWTVTNSEPLATVPVKEPKRQIDYVLVSPANRWRTIEVSVLDEKVASDHRAILAVVELVQAGDFDSEQGPLKSEGDES